MLALYALLGASLLMLRLANPSGSFPRALDAAEERRLVEDVYKRQHRVSGTISGEVDVASPVYIE